MGEKTKADVLKAPFTCTDISGVVLEVVDKTDERKAALKKNPKASQRTAPLYADEVGLIIVHCSATPADRTGADINRMHIEKGWAGCGYHYVIGPQENPPRTKMVDGVEKQVVTVEMWRDPHAKKDTPGEMGAHANGLNAHSVGICWIGEKEAPSFAQRQAFKLLTQQLQQDFPHAAVTGHRDCGAPKTCPNFDAAGLWQAENPDACKATPEKFPDQQWTEAKVLERLAALRKAEKAQENPELPEPKSAVEATTKPSPTTKAPQKTVTPKNEAANPEPPKVDPEKAGFKKFIPWPGRKKTKEQNSTTEPENVPASKKTSARTVSWLASPEHEPTQGDADAELAHNVRGRELLDIAAKAELPALFDGIIKAPPTRLATPETESKIR